MDNQRLIFTVQPAANRPADTLQLTLIIRQSAAGRKKSDLRVLGNHTDQLGTDSINYLVQILYDTPSDKPSVYPVDNQTMRCKTTGSQLPNDLVSITNTDRIRGGYNQCKIRYCTGRTYSESQSRRHIQKDQIKVSTQPLNQQLNILQQDLSH